MKYNETPNDANNYKPNNQHYNNHSMFICLLGVVYVVEGFQRQMNTNEYK